MKTEKITSKLGLHEMLKEVLQADGNDIKWKPDSI